MRQAEIGRHSSVVSSAPTILRLWVRIPSTPSTLFQFVLLRLQHEKDENKQKEAGIGPFFKNRPIDDLSQAGLVNCLRGTCAPPPKKRVIGQAGHETMSYKKI